MFLAYRVNEFGKFREKSLVKIVEKNVDKLEK
jgi:hypothetical protein